MKTVKHVWISFLTLICQCLLQFPRAWRVRSPTRCQRATSRPSWGMSPRASRYRAESPVTTCTGNLRNEHGFLSAVGNPSGEIMGAVWSVKKNKRLQGHQYVAGGNFYASRGSFADPRGRNMGSAPWVDLRAPSICDHRELPWSFCRGSSADLFGNWVRPLLVLTHSWQIIGWWFSAASRVVPLVAVLNTKDRHHVENLKTGPGNLVWISELRLDAMKISLGKYTAK